MMFEILSAALKEGASAAARLGRLAFPGRRPIDTPNFIAVTSRGTLPHVTPDNIRIDADQGSAGLAILRRDLGQIEVSTGLRRHTLMGAGIGFAVGACTGAAIGASMEPGMAGTSGNVAVGAVLFGVVGLAIGTIAGTLYRTERWTRLSSNAQSAVGSPRQE